jgi:hypothetical protein
LKKTPELTLNRTVRLLRSAFKLAILTTEMAIRLVQYQIQRNRLVMRSSAKTWMQKHGQKKYRLFSKACG